MADKSDPRSEALAVLRKRLEELPEWPDEVQRRNPGIDRLQGCQSVDANVLFRTLRIIKDHPARASFEWLAKRLEQHPNHTVLDVSGFHLQGLIKALEEGSKPGVNHG